MALPSVLPFQPQFNYPNNKLYQYEVYPILLSCNFVVDPTNGNGLGIRNLKGAGIANVFMVTNETPLPGNYGYRPQNPSSGIIIVQFQNQFNRYLGGFTGQVAPLTGSNLTASVQSVPNVITSLGTATLAQWQAVGFPVGMVPSVGACFVASSSSTIGGGATVSLVGSSGIDHIEVCGDPNQTMQNSNLYQSGGAQMVLQTMFEGARTQPTTNTVISLSFYLSNSSIQVDGQ